MLQAIADADPSQWHFWLEPTQIGSVLSKLNQQIHAYNFFDKNFNINVFFNFLKRFVSEKIYNSDILKAFNAVCQQIQNKIISQASFDSDQLNKVTHYLNLIETMLKADHRYLFDIKEISIDALSLKQLAEAVSVNQSNVLDNKFLYAYTSRR